MRKKLEEVARYGEMSNLKYAGSLADYLNAYIVNSALDTG